MSLPRYCYNLFPSFHLKIKVHSSGFTFCHLTKVTLSLRSKRGAWDKWFAKAFSCMLTRPPANESYNEFRCRKTHPMKSNILLIVFFLACLCKAGLHTRVKTRVQVHAVGRVRRGSTWQSYGTLPAKNKVARLPLGTIWFR